MRNEDLRTEYVIEGSPDDRDVLGDRLQPKVGVAVL